MSKRSEVSSPIVLLESSQLKSRPWFLHVHFDEEKALIVTKSDVVLRSILLDQLAFEQERLGLIAHFMNIKIPDTLNEGAGLVLCHSLPGRSEIGSETLSQIPRLPNIDHCSKPITMKVHSWLVRHITELLLEIRFCVRGHEEGYVTKPEGCNPGENPNRKYPNFYPCCFISRNWVGEKPVADRKALANALWSLNPQ